MNWPRKVKVLCPLAWSHHHSGWPFVVNGLYRHFQNETGVDFFTNGIVGRVIESTSSLTEPWIGVLHATPTKELEYNLAKNTHCSKSLSLCKGLYALSNYVKNFVEANSFVRSETLFLPVERPALNFSLEQFEQNPDKKLVMIGHWLRRIESIYKLESHIFRKCILRCTNINYDAGVDIIGFLEAYEYEELLSKNVVFLDLIDASANNTVVECIVRCTPILINRLPATEEYLGNDYPLFYNTLKEASDKAGDYKSIKAAHEYLLNIDKSPFTLEYFLQSFADSFIYKSLGSGNKLFL